MTNAYNIKKGQRYRLNQDMPRIKKDTTVVVMEIRHNNSAFPCVILDPNTRNMDVCRYDQLIATYGGTSGTEQ